MSEKELVSDKNPTMGGEAALREVVDALRIPSGGDEPDCAICRRTTQSVTRGLRAFFAEFVNDPRTREEFRQARGFCTEHTRELTTSGDALAIAILYADLARLTRERWEALEGSARTLRTPWSRANRLETAAPCPSCVLARDAETRYAGALADGLNRQADGVWEAVEAEGVLCVPHIELVLASASKTTASRLRQHEMTRLAALQTELEEIIRKNDYRFRGEPWGPERDAWRRALQKLRRPR